MEQLKKIIEKISAGRAALDDISAEKLFNNISDVIHNGSATIKSADIEELTDFKELLARVNSSRFSREIASYIDKDKYFSFGQELLKKNIEWDNILLSVIIHEYLDIFRQSEFLQKIYNERRWDEPIAKLIRVSGYTTDVMFKQRVRDYSSKPFIKQVKHNHIKSYSWDEISDIVLHYQKALYSQLIPYRDNEIHTAFLMENSLDMACLDFACLSGGIVNVMIPANSVPQHISFILNQTKVPVVLISDEKQLAKIKSVKKELPHLEKVILLSGKSVESWAYSFEEFLSCDTNISEISKTLRSRQATDSLSTIMYTSGTTGEPKGIMFSNMNIVYKRFCRAMALPKIGDKDRFIAYLPLFHTFGRYLELVGSVFWGAEYVFMENPSLQAMLSNMQLVNPTIFISIPKKWMQLYEYISTNVDIELDSEKLIGQTVEEATGFELKWGLSAAGFLPPEVFQFFQKNSIELMSGFGMTEATGGITMTPPDEYRTNSLGCALPGIEIKTAEDGELLIRGDYVMMNYYAMQKEEVFDEEGWLATGDIMREDDDGFIEIIDRKKEIYKNIKGETIAPQKIENFFRDFVGVKQVFLVGDHRPFNTILIYPNTEPDDSILLRMNDEERNEYFSSLTVTVNNFLAPFERIVDFRLIDRPFSIEQGELTAKGTYKRRVIETNFNEIIEPMYIRNYTELIQKNLKIKIPNWFLREKGCLSNDVVIKENKIVIIKTETELVFKPVSENLVQIGDFTYRIHSSTVDFQNILIDPNLWLGNSALYTFAGDSIIQWHKNFGQASGISFSSISSYYKLKEEDVTRIEEFIRYGETSLSALHVASLLIQTDSNYPEALTLIENCLNDETIVSFYANEIIKRPQFGIDLNTRRRMISLAVGYFSTELLFEDINRFVEYDSNIIDETIIKVILNSSRKPDKIEGVIKLLRINVEKFKDAEDISKTCIPSLMDLVCQYSVNHPSTYEKTRQVLVEYQIIGNNMQLSEIAASARRKLRAGFREWLGANQTIAVDMETGDEYGWEDVIIFEEGTDKNDLERIQGSIINTPVLREAIFLVSPSKVIQLNNILPGGIWISLLRKFHNKSSYRVSIQTRHQGSFEVVLNLNYGRTPEEVKEEVNLLILAGSRKFLHEFVEDFGGYWDEYEIWSSKYMPGESVEKFLIRETRRLDDANVKRLYHTWPFFVWNAAAAYMNFWRLTGYKQILSDPSLDNFIIPSHDYQRGTKIISFSGKYDYKNLVDLFRNFYTQFIEPAENKYEFLRRNKVWSFVFAGVINAEGEENGLKILHDFRDELLHKSVIDNQGEIEAHLNEFMQTVERGDYIPKQLYFAIKRFHRWNRLNEDADMQAQAKMLKDLYDTYRLAELNESFPEVRAKLYFESVFCESSDELKVVLMDIIGQYHNHKISESEELTMLSSLHAQFDLTDEEKFFLTRLIFPHLKPTDSAKLIEFKIDGKASSNLVVEYEDYDGLPFYIRKPISPKEISRLHEKFIDANLLVTFRQEHEYLLAISDRGFIIGGLFYERQDDDIAHMEKIVVSNRYRRKGISDKLMNEFFERMQNDRYKFVTTGFFRPEYFYKFGFKVEKKYSGLVKIL